MASPLVLAFTLSALLFFSHSALCKASHVEEPEVDEKDVVVLKGTNFSDVVEKNRFVLVNFYAPWCRYSRALAPEYAAAATELKGEDVILAKVDATVENELAQEYDVPGFPTVFLFIDGVDKPYTGQRTKEGIVTWIRIYINWVVGGPSNAGDSKA